MSEEVPTVFVIAPDRQTAAVAARALDRAGLPRIDVAPTQKEASRLVSRLVGAAAADAVLVLAPCFPRAAFDAVAAMAGRGGLAVCVEVLPSEDDAGRDGWLLGQLLAQRGCLPFRDLDTAVEAIRVHAFLGGAAAPRVKRRPGKGAVGRRLEASAARLGISATADDRREDLLLDIADDGSVSFRGRSGALELFHPETSLAALALLAARPVAGALDAEVVSVDEDVVELIARPPRRLLSEIASKRLVSAFGIAPPRERLSTSATEATRFETELGPGVVLKLVRPALENKTALGAIEPGVNGATAVRRAYHRLLRVGESLGPPAPLGVLVAEEISGGAHVWLERAKSETFGLVVLGGAGDRPTSAPGFALAAPATGAEAERALLRVELEATVSQREALAAAISRFSTLVAALGDRIHRAEIHSLVARAEGPALAVDALIGVSD